MESQNWRFLFRAWARVYVHTRGRPPLVKRLFVWSTSQIRGVSNRPFLYRLAEGFKNATRFGYLYIHRLELACYGEVKRSNMPTIQYDSVLLVPILNLKPKVLKTRPFLELRRTTWVTAGVHCKTQ